MIDFNLGELGVTKARKLSSTEIAIRRIVAITYGDKHNNWDTASHIEDGHFSLLTARQERQMLSAAKLARQLESPETKTNLKPAAKGKAGNEE
jgi:hypothetical protein